MPSERLSLRSRYSITPPRSTRRPIPKNSKALPGSYSTSRDHQDNDFLKTPVQRPASSILQSLNNNTTPNETPRTAKKTKPKKDNNQSSFAKCRERLTADLIQELDDTVFANRLPPNLEIVWNKRMTSTAGQASWKRFAY